MQKLGSNREDMLHCIDDCKRFVNFANEIIIRTIYDLLIISLYDLFCCTIYDE